jgi:hypothetical protein
MEGLDNLTPEEKEELRTALGGGFDMDAVIDKIGEVLDLHEERIKNIETAVFDELIGGIKGLHAKNMRANGVRGLKEKYGEKFGPYEETFSSMKDGGDLYESLMDELEALKSDAGESWNDETELGAVDGIYEKMKKVLKEKVVPVIEGEAPGAVEVEVTPEEEKAEPEVSGEDEIMNEVKKLKGRHRSANQ